MVGRVLSLPRWRVLMASATPPRCAFGAPSVAWDPGRKVPPVRGGSGPGTIGITVHLPDDAVLTFRAAAGSTLLEALQGADLGDVWLGGQCGGACSCSTCRVVVTHAPAGLGPRGDDEEDMLETAAFAAERMAQTAGGEGVDGGEGGEGGGSSGDGSGFLGDASRLSCQVVLRPEDDGLAVLLPPDVTNVLEVPLWLRGQR